jgi:hypothetical protein
MSTESIIRSWWAQTHWSLPHIRISINKQRSRFRWPIGLPDLLPCPTTCLPSQDKLSRVVQEPPGLVRRTNDLQEPRVVRRRNLHPIRKRSLRCSGRSTASKAASTKHSSLQISLHLRLRRCYNRSLPRDLGSSRLSQAIDIYLVEYLEISVSQILNCIYASKDLPFIFLNVWV